MGELTYNSIAFFLFLAVFFAVYFLMPKSWLKLGVILAGNIVFYRFAGGWNALFVLIGTSVVVYAASIWIGGIYRGFQEASSEMTPKERMAFFADGGYKKRAKRIVAIAIILVAGVLVYTKVGKMLGFWQVAYITNLRWGSILVPLGLSYYTFSAIGYLLDVYWKKAAAEKNYVKVLTAMTFFPIIVQGPITRYDKLMKQFAALPPFDYDRFCRGLQLVLWGLFQKMIVADRIFVISDTIFGNISKYAGVEVVLAVLCNVIAIYTDFSGCMDIVRGVAECMGINLERNFEQPFFAKGAAEFWRRWHITLGAWFRDYIFMPMSTSPKHMKFTFNARKKYGNHAGQVLGTVGPLLVVWLLTGLWHGTGWNYILWGLYWFALIVFESAMAPSLKRFNAFLHVREGSFGHRLFQMIRTVIYFSIGRMFTAINAGDSILLIFNRIFAQARLWVLFDGTVYEYGLEQKEVFIMLIGVAIVWIADVLQSRMCVRDVLARQSILIRWPILIAGILAVLVFGVYGTAFDAADFVYGGF